MRSKKYLGTLFILTLLASMATITLPSTSSSSTVTFRVEDVTKDAWGYPGLVAADIYIDSPEGSAIIGWTVDIKVNPDVLEPGYDFGGDVYWASSGFSGYFLYDWCDGTTHPNWPPGTEFDQGSADVTAGTITGTIEGIVAWVDLEKGTGASGTGKLVTLFFTYKNETAYSPILITEAYYYTSLNSPNLDKRVPDVITHGHYNTQPAHDVTVTYISAPTAAVAGHPVEIGVEVFNIGNNNETFTLKVSNDTTVIETRPVSLNSLKFETVWFTWNTAHVAPGDYTITANATLEGDENLNNNVKTAPIKLVYGIHDVAVTAISAPSQAQAGDIVTISVNVTNEGNVTDSFSVTVRYDSEEIGTEPVDLDPGKNITVDFEWDSTGANGIYTITAEAVLETDIDTADNVDTTTIKIGELWRVDLVQRSAWPEHHHHVESKHTWVIKFFGIIKNVGTEPTEGKVVFTIEDSEGGWVANITTNPQSLEPEEIYKGIYTAWNAESAGYDKYYVTANAYYKDAYGEWQKSPDKPKTFSFTVKP